MRKVMICVWAAMSLCAPSAFGFRELTTKARLVVQGTIKATRDVSAGRVYNPSMPLISWTDDGTYDSSLDSAHLTSHHEQTFTTDYAVDATAWRFQTTMTASGVTDPGVHFDLDVGHTTTLHIDAPARITIAPTALDGGYPSVGIAFTDAGGAALGGRTVAAGAAPATFDFLLPGDYTMDMDWLYATPNFASGDSTLTLPTLGVDWSFTSIPEPALSGITCAALSCLIRRRRSAR